MSKYGPRGFIIRNFECACWKEGRISHRVICYERLCDVKTRYRDEFFDGYSLFVPAGEYEDSKHHVLVYICSSHLLLVSGNHVRRHL